MPIFYSAPQILINFSEQPHSGLVLCPGQYLIILAFSTSNSPLHVRVYSFLSFDGLWGSIRKLYFNNRIDATQIRPSTTLELPGNAMVDKSHCEHIMTVLESPLRADTYELIFEVMDFDGPAVAETPFRRPFTRLLSLFRSNAPRPGTIPRLTWSRHLLTLQHSLQHPRVSP